MWWREASALHLHGEMSLPFPQEEQAGPSPATLLLRGEQAAAPAVPFGVSSALCCSSAAAAVVQHSFRGGRPPISKSGRNRGSNLVTRDEMKSGEWIL